MKFLSILILLLLLISCVGNKKEHKKEFEFKTDVEFISGSRKGYISDIINKKGNKYFCAKDYLNDKKLVIHSLNDSLKIDVPLENIINQGQKILNVDIQALDSIWVLTSYTNKLYLINHKGEIQKTLDINPYLELEKENSMTFEMYSKNNMIINDTTLIVHLTPYLEDDEPFDFVDYHIKLYTTNTPFLLKIDNIYSDSLILTFGLYNFNNRFSEIDDFSGELARINLANNEVFIHSYYSDTIYQISLEDLSVKNSFVPKSKYSKLSTNPPKLIDQLKNGNLHNEIQSKTGAIMNIKYSDYYHLYFVSVYHESDKILEPFYDKVGSILIFDESFNQIDEVKLSEEYSGGYVCFTDSNSIFVSNYKKVYDDTNFFEKNTFSIFTYE